MSNAGRINFIVSETILGFNLYVNLSAFIFTECPIAFVGKLLKSTKTMLRPIDVPESNDHKLRTLSL